MSVILVVEDDADTAEVIQLLLEQSHFEVILARDGVAGLAQVEKACPDLIISDVNLPLMDGLALCREVRKEHQVPILMLSARQEELDKVLGLELGADDYLGKPFSGRELVARVKALLRRPATQAGPALIRSGPLTIDPQAREVLVSGQAVSLTASEFSLLQVLASRPKRVLSRQQLADLALGEDWVGDERTVDVHIRRMRAKLQAQERHEYVTAVRGVGYKFVAPQ